MGTQLAFPKGAQSPNFRPLSAVAKRSGWTKMPHGMETGLGPGDFVFDLTTPRKKGTPIPTHVYCGHGRPSQLLLSYCLYKSTAVAEMGDRGHNRHGPKRGEWG